MPTTNDKIDLFKLHKHEYAAPKTPTVIDVGPGRYLAIDGGGVPGGGAFEDAVGALYGLAYTLKFAGKAAGRDFTVCKLEGLWSNDGSVPLGKTRPDDWLWTLLIRVPDFVGDDQLAAARRSLLDKGKDGDFDSVTLIELHEGRCVQMLHVGPYEQEQTTIAAMKTHAEEQGLHPSGRHHEIYLSDPRRVPPEKLRTILRQPVAD